LAKAELDSAQREYDRVKYGPNADDIAVAQAAVDAAQATVNKMKIIAPFDCEVIVIYNQEGDQVSQGESSVILVNREKCTWKSQLMKPSISNI
jgi:HlyD family secretion protein